MLPLHVQHLLQRQRTQPGYLADASQGVTSAAHAEMGWLINAFLAPVRQHVGQPD
jgi:hypothetical protein